MDRAALGGCQVSEREAEVEECLGVVCDVGEGVGKGYGVDLRSGGEDFR